MSYSLSSSCWSSSVFQLKAVVMQELAVIEKGEFDVFFSHRWASKAFLSHLHALLTKLGKIVYFSCTYMCSIHI